ncbi:MAG: ribonuclease R family protein [Solirubrobacteraceae bacterium]
MNARAGRPERESRAASWVGVLERRGRFYSALPFFEPGQRVTVDRPRAAIGQLVLVAPSRRGGRGARVLRALGEADVARDVLEALLLDRALAREFDAAVQDDARMGTERAAASGVRRDLRELPTFTIDPVSARDFDDAISAEAIPGADDAWRIWVHIADVAAHVEPGSPLDREAYRRATSVYVPGLVEPMLPESLSNQACSLVPGQERLAVSVELELRGAQVRSSSFFRSLIVSDVRLDYDRVDRIFAGTEAAQGPWATPLAVARRAAAVLGDARYAKGALAVSSEEAEFAFTDDGRVTALPAAEPTESHRLIEQLMIAANEAVATLLERSRVPTLYRIHERPEPAAVERLVEQLASLGVATPPLPERLSPQQAEDVVGELSHLIDRHVRRTGRGRRALTSLLLRSLKQARYSPVNTGHAGLRSPRYCHFTSPIRRYPDLVCHRALLSAVSGDERAPDAAALVEAGDWTSDRERNAMTIERDADDIARCMLLEAALYEGDWNQKWEGEVIGLIEAGAFVAFGEGPGYEGFLPVRRLRGDWWELNAPGTILHGTRSGATIRLGDPLAVQVGRIDAPRGRVDLYPAPLDDVAS